ncbi:MAG: hypothetical protein PVG19_08565 [Desulfobacterales bacterium]|jgi:hypothetical protein
MTLNRILLIVLTAIGAIVAASILVYHMLTSGRLAPLALLLVAAVISIALPMLRSNFFPSAKDCLTEFDFHTRRREVFIRQQITDKLGPAAFHPIDTDQRAEAYLLTALDHAQHHPDEDLRFALLAALAQHHERHGDPDAAIRSLTEASRSRPTDFVTRFQLARNYEWRGDQVRALQAYRQLLAAPGELSRAMRRLTRQRIKDLENR